MNHSTLLVWLISVLCPSLMAQTAARFSGVQSLPNDEIRLQLEVSGGDACQIETSADLERWIPLTTFLSSGAHSHTDSATPQLSHRFYRAVTTSPATNLVTGDHLDTDNGVLTIHPVNHASLVMTWNGLTIYSDPVGGAARFRGLPQADLILVTHSHGDHFDAATINVVKAADALIFTPRLVYQSLPATLRTSASALANGATTNLLNLTIEAVPAYNLTSSRHVKGDGNGYVVTMGGKRIYISGDTEDIPEMRALRDIDIAFVCMNLPFTMSVDTAASAVRDFQPVVVYPYHYFNSDVNRFKQLMNASPNVEVRLRNWY